jgi:hypothetical protein
MIGKEKVSHASRETLVAQVVLALLMPLSGCDSSRQSSRSSLYDNGRFMDLWSTYTHCYRSEDLDAMRTDAQRLSQALDTIDSAEGPIPLESNEPVPLGPTVRLSADPAAMAAACPPLHAGQAAQEWDARTLHERCSTWSSQTFRNHAIGITWPKPD